MSFDWKGVVKTVAPAIASTLGGPLGGMGISALLGVLGIDAKPDDDDVEEKISQALINPSPETLLAMKQADHQFKVDMKKLDIDLERINLENVQGARRMRETMKDRFPDVITVLVTIGFFAILAVHVFHEIPSGNKTLLNIMLGSLGAVWIDQMRFYFGSSQGSKTKEALLAKGGTP